MRWETQPDESQPHIAEEEDIGAEVQQHRPNNEVPTRISTRARQPVKRLQADGRRKRYEESEATGMDSDEE